MTSLATWTFLLTIAVTFYTCHCEGTTSIGYVAEAILSTASVEDTPEKSTSQDPLNSTAVNSNTGVSRKLTLAQTTNTATSTRSASLPEKSGTTYLKAEWGTTVPGDISEAESSTTTIGYVSNTAIPQGTTTLLNVSEATSSTTSFNDASDSTASQGTTALGDISKATPNTTSIGYVSATTISKDIPLILCEGERETVVCQNDSVLEFVFASYGYNGSNTSAREKCDHLVWFWERGTSETRCHQPNSSLLLSYKCGGRSECDVFASNNIFGDPCPGTSKFLDVIFRCKLEHHQSPVLTSPTTAQSGSLLVPTIPRKEITSTVVTQTQMRSNTDSDRPQTTTWQEHRQSPVTASSTETQSGSSLVHTIQRREITSTAVTQTNFSSTSNRSPTTRGQGVVTEASSSATNIGDASSTTIAQGRPVSGVTGHKFVTVLPVFVQLHYRNVRVCFGAGNMYLILCEDQTETVVCPNDSVIEVVSASYGYNGSNTSARDKCDPLAWVWSRGSSQTRCFKQNSSQILTSACGGRSFCDVSASNEFFGDDPCPKITKFLEVFYSCRLESLHRDVTTIQNVAQNASSMSPLIHNTTESPDRRVTTTPIEGQNDSSISPSVQRIKGTSTDVSESQMSRTTPGDRPPTTAWQEGPDSQETTIPNTAQNDSSLSPRIHKSTDTSNEVSRPQTRITNTDSRTRINTWQSGIAGRDQALRPAQASILIWLLLTIVVAGTCTAAFALILWKRCRKGKRQFIELQPGSQTDEHSMKVLGSTYKVFGSNESEEANSIA